MGKVYITGLIYRAIVSSEKVLGVGGQNDILFCYYAKMNLS